MPCKRKRGAIGKVKVYKAGTGRKAGFTALR